MWGIIATWDFADAPVKAAAELLKSGASALDAAERCGVIIENDEAVDTVGYGGFPNARGEVELDAALMDGRALDIGAVCAVKHHKNPISIARKLLYQRHNLLAGEEADEFADTRGMARCELLTEKTREKFLEISSKYPGEPYGHDTVGIVALGSDGNVVAGTSTSGIGLKMPGRVGDSPLVGSGFYADDFVGGAAATGMGEDIMKTCASFYACELMRAGVSAAEAAQKAVCRAHTELARRGKKPGNIALVVMDRLGNFAGAANHEGFCFAAASETRAARLYKVSPAVLRESSNTGIELYNNIAPQA